MQYALPGEINAAHLDRYWSVLAVSEQEDVSREVWNSRRLLPFLNADSPATLVEHLYVRVRSLDDSDLSPLLKALEAADPMGGRRLLSIKTELTVSPVMGET